MTAVAGILNKQGVAIAADSAVTISGPHNRKVYNSANKIFTLSKYHPVGIVIYNSAQLMGIPWEVLIKEYRKQLKKKSFPKLIDYKNDFFRWLHSKRYFLEDENNDFLFYDYLFFSQTLVETFFKENRAQSTDLQKEIIQFISDYIKKEIPRHDKIESLKYLNKEKTIKCLNSLSPELVKIISNDLKRRINFNFDFNEIGVHLAKAYYEYLIHDQFLQFTGLIFTGYGEDEIFPRLYPVNVSIVIDNMLRWHDDKYGKAEISNKQNSCIRPFAQTDVINTILQGISPELNILSANVFKSFMNEFVNEINALGGIPKSHLGSLNIDKYVQRYQEQFDVIIKKRYVSPLMDAVAQLSKEDLAEMAESLVYITYLKRRFTMAEESVGGPVDIAVITKGDGFVWIKRKHYFDPELNQNFFKKYF